MKALANEGKMTQVTLSRIFFWVLFALLLFIRAFFSIRASKSNQTHQTGIEAHGFKGLIDYIIGHFRVGQEQKSNFIFRRLIATPIFIVLLYLVFTDSSWIRPFTIPFPLVGMCLGLTLGLIGLVFLIWVHLSLGKQWSVSLELHKDHNLIQSGPYVKIRHPMYTALCSIYLGMGLVSENYLMVCAMALIIISVAARVPQEEKMLIERYGDAYRNYIQRTGMFFPKI
jgi:protein-S-isoprenylcysteine O-methyltransferase Ste14